MRHAAHGATKSKGRNDSPLSLFVAKRGAHGAHGAHGVRAVSQSNAQIDAQNSLAGERLAAISASNGAVVEISEAVSQRLQELIPQTRRELRLSRLANDRRRRLVFSASLVAMVGAVATTMSLAKVNSMDSRAAEVANAMSTVDDSNVEVSRSTQREPLDSMAVIDNAVNELENDVHAGSAKANTYGDAVNQPGTASTTSSQSDSWNLGAGSSFNIAEMSRSAADNPQVALLMDKDADVLPKSFNPNHGTGDIGNAYEFSQCTWWVYLRRHQLGLPVGSHFGNGGMWADSARALGYWVDNSARHVGDIMVFRPGQAGSSSVYGHVAVVEKINPDGSVETSESGSSFNGRTFSRRFEANQLSSYQFIHY